MDTASLNSTPRQCAIISRSSPAQPASEASRRDRTMSKSVTLILLSIMLTGVAANAEARGRHGHARSHFDFYIGGPLWLGPGPVYRHHTYYYGPQTIIIEREPPVYIQRQPTYSTTPPPQTAAPTAQVWYYCTDPAGYYPYVSNCAQPWVSVDPSSVQAPPNR